MSVYKEQINLTSHGVTPSFFDITPSVKEAIKKSKIQNGICVVISPHTTCSVFFEEFVHDYNENGDEFLQADLNNVLKKIIPEDAYASYIDREVYNYGIYVNDHAIYWGMSFVDGVDIKILDYNFQSECHDILIGNHLVEFDGDFYCNYQLTKESI